ncbi:MAG: DUF2163 domain-containing protein [Pseudomonadota bacterium]
MSLQAHLEAGCTTVCRAWVVIRNDGIAMGFTDHDRAFEFEGVSFRASTGLSARAVEQSTGLSVDNSEALGALSDAAIREEDIRAGRFDGAELQSWLVNWANPEERRLVFRGTLGEIERQGNGFRAELRSQAEALNQPQGRVYQRPCAAVLGDARCGALTVGPGVSVEAEVVSVSHGTELVLPSQASFDDGWFARGRLTVLGGAAAGRVGAIKRDREVAGQRLVELWEVLSAGFAPGDLVRLEPGCDKTAATCRAKFGNFLNYRGFPDIPGEDWLVSYPVSSGRNDGGSLG